jgi:glutamate/tyrosine decarboxylase-like PLP-dependent enzyme
VTGGTLDAALVAEILAVGWDQCAYNVALSPAAIAFEDVAGDWLKDLLGLPPTASVGFATGTQGANTIGLAAARSHVLNEAGWDVGRDGLHGAPRVKVVVGAERHATIDRSVRLLGLGESAIVECRLAQTAPWTPTRYPQRSRTAYRRSSAHRWATSTRARATR